VKEQVTNCEQKSRHCGLNPQSPASNAFNKRIAGQARNDGTVRNNSDLFRIATPLVPHGSQ